MSSPFIFILNRMRQVVTGGGYDGFPAASRVKAAISGQEEAVMVSAFPAAGANGIGIAQEPISLPPL
jgi:hypothetical protein